MKYLSGAILAVALLAACDDQEATVLQLDANTFQVIGTGYSEKSALESAINTANKRCADQGKEAFILANDTGYQGVDQNAAMIINVLTTAANASKNVPEGSF